MPMLNLPEQLFTRRDINSQEFRLYSQLLYLSKKHKTKRVSVSQLELSEMCNLSKRTVITYLQSLSNKGFIETFHVGRKEGKGRDTNIYVLKY